MRILGWISVLVYVIVSIVLTAIALTLIAHSVREAWLSVSGGGSNAVSGLLDSIGLIVISLAVLDVSKYLMEEEVLRDRELRSALEARRTLTKFMVIICIAVSLEAVVYISMAGKEGVQNLVYPAILLLSAVAVMVGLGAYQKMSGAIETKDQKQNSATSPDNINNEPRDDTN
jgi:hypothetical protein